MTKPMPPSMQTIPLDRPSPVQVGPGGSLTLQGTARSSHDGSAYRADELFDLTAGGLKAAKVSDSGEITLVKADLPGSVCQAQGMGATCLVPKLREHAHKRLLTEADFAKTLTGKIVAVVEVPPPPPPFLRTGKGQAMMGGVFLSLVFALLAMLWMGKRAAFRRTPIGQVLVAASEAERALANEPSADVLRGKVRALVDRAKVLEEARKTSEGRLRRLDETELAKRRRHFAAVPSEDAIEALKVLDAELAEAGRLRDDAAASQAGLERIASALRTLPLRVRAHRGTRAKSATADPVEELADELALRESSAAEAEALLRK